MFILIDKIYYFDFELTRLILKDRRKTIKQDINITNKISIYLPYVEIILFYC